MSIVELTMQYSERAQSFEELLDVVANLKGDLAAEQKRDRAGRAQAG
jgi:hypothetical protein